MVYAHGPEVEGEAVRVWQVGPGRSHGDVLQRYWRPIVVARPEELHVWQHAHLLGLHGIRAPGPVPIHPYWVPAGEIHQGEHVKPGDVGGEDEGRAVARLGPDVLSVRFRHLIFCLNKHNLQAKSHDLKVPVMPIKCIDMLSRIKNSRISMMQ